VNESTRAVLTGQFLAALDMLENAIHACPDAVWGDTSREPQFWYLVHHTLFWTDCYLADSSEAYRPPPPFGLEELDPAGVMPPRVYTREELLPWLERCRERCRVSIAGLTEANAVLPAGFPSQRLNRLELLLDNMRHAQHHAAQLNLLLRQRIDSAPRWVAHHREEAGA
jgi:hypothetical protein